ncbi:MAG: GNAT family N-acetyltransferase [Firmicutes bacterium]|nr:GNAT family N-acetyltransferase [Bacillota bacterium]
MSIFDILGLNSPFRIDGKRLYIRPLKRKEVEIIKTWFEDKELISHAFGVIARNDTLEKISSEYMKDIFLVSTEILGIFLNSGELIGFINYSMKSGRHTKRARLGIVIGREAKRQQGYGKESLNLALFYLFNIHGVDIVELDTASFNLRAQNCFLSCGFQIVRETTDINLITGELIHKIDMILEREDFFLDIAERFEELPKAGTCQ